MNQATMNEVVLNFDITANRHASKHPQFRDGIWYGFIDGHCSTAPAFSENAALEWARQALLGTGYIAGLTDYYNCLERNKNDEHELVKAKARIDKYYQNFPAEIIQ